MDKPTTGELKLLPDKRPYEYRRRNTEIAHYWLNITTKYSAKGNPNATENTGPSKD